MSAATSCTVGPWLLRNWLAGRDPVYPFGFRVFASLGYSAAELAKTLRLDYWRHHMNGDEALIR